MKKLAQWISWLALAGTLAPAILFFYGRLNLDQVKTAMMAAMIVWFAATPLWMEHKTTD